MQAQPWTEEEDRYLRENYESRLIKEIARDIHRTYAAISARLRKLGLRKRYRDWTPEDDEFLRENWHKLKHEELARHLRRTRGAVRTRARNLKITIQATPLHPPENRDGVGIIPIHSRQYPGLEAIVDLNMIDMISQYRWQARKSRNTFYAVTYLRGPKPHKQVYMHRMILNTKYEIDHKNRNGLDNRKENLRPATPGQNQANRTIRPGKYKGTLLNTKKGKHKRPWIAAIGINKQTRNLGCFSTREEAARAYDQAAKCFFGEFANINFPEEDRS